MNPQEILLRLVNIQKKFADRGPSADLEVALVQILIDGFEEEKDAGGAGTIEGTEIAG